ncbi:MAG TPA: hypothetical protein VGW32_07850 [Pyrinomonadaceae bacterium]|nr:hypothetical protein [Pyrinomonadaceae bacterium]
MSFASDAPNSRSVTAQTRQPVIVFAVSGEAGEGNMDAVALVSGRQFKPPYREENKQDETAFALNYFATGKQYRLIFGGGEAGTVTVKKWSEGCNNIHSEVTVGGPHLGGQVRALATNSDSLGKRASSRRAPTADERAAVLKLVRTIYRQRRTPANLLNSIKVTNLTATDIDGDSKAEFVGSFMLTTRGRGSGGSEGPIKFERDLFLIAKGDASSVRGDFVKFQAYRPPPEQFLSSIDYVDQLDVDGDGIGEVFTIQGGFDAYAYVIFKKVGGRWREVYQGIGDAC